MTQKQKEKKPWFLKRWTYRFLTWLDELLFGGKATRNFTSAALPFWITAVINFWLGMVMIIWSMFVDSGTRDQILSIGAGVGLVSVLAVTVWYLIGTLKFFRTTGTKIFRSIYVLILCILGFLVGFYSAVIFSFVLIGLFVLMVLYYAVFGDSGKSKKGSQSSFEPTYKVGDADYSNSTGKDLHYRGDGLWHDDDGHAYRKESNEYYQIH